MSEPIRVWKFSEAPAEYRAMAVNGDWLAHVPAGPVPPWLRCSCFGQYTASTQLSDGSWVCTGKDVKAENEWVRQAVAAEREGCAMTAESFASRTPNSIDQVWLPNDIAAAIRKRG